jgi:hypothetical protein
MTCPDCPFMASCHICPVLAVLSHPPCPVPAVLPWLSYLGCLVPAVLCCLISPSCCIFPNGSPAAIVLSQLSYPAGLAHLSWLHVSALLFPSFSVPAVLSMLSCFDCPVYLFRPGFLSWVPSSHVLAVMFWASCPFCLSSLTCPG